MSVFQVPMAGAQMELRTTEPQFALGTANMGPGNVMWVYVQASGTIADGDDVALSAGFVATVDNTTGTHTAAVGFANGEYGWVSAV